MKKSLISLVVPVYNEADGISIFLEELYRVLLSLSYEFEVIMVDDGSRDKTSEIIMSEKYEHLKLISLSRNFGHQAALLAGLEEAKGEFIVTLDGDLQHPPSLIPKLLEQHEKGIDVVLTKRLSDSETKRLKNDTSVLFYRVLNRISSQKILENGSDFRSLNRQALDALLSMPEKRKFLRGMVQWIGFTQVVIPFSVGSRVAGESKYSVLKMFSLALFGITSFTTIPLYLSAVFGLILFSLAAIYAVYVIFAKLFFSTVVEGWASVLFVQLAVGGFICLFLGLFGIYLAAIYDEVKQRPDYIVKDVHEPKQKN